MAAKKSGARTRSGIEKKGARVRWPFPRATLQEASKIGYAIKDHNGGNPWEPDEVRKAIGAGTGGNAYFYLTVSPISIKEPGMIGVMEPVLGS